MYLLHYYLYFIKAAVAALIPSPFDTTPQTSSNEHWNVFPSVNQGQRIGRGVIVHPGSNHTGPATALIKTDKYRQAVNEMSGRNKALPFMPTDDTNGEEK